MRIVVSIQSKRGSSRGLVHYISHSKIDPEKERLGGRELFNEFGDSLDVKSVNNSLKTDTSRKRPANEELHHLVLSFRREDYEKLGSTEKERKRAAMKITRSSTKRLETHLDAERLAWAATVHRNTQNPHVHIAIQKQYFTKDLEKRCLSKIPREAIPHYQQAGNDRILLPGFLIEAAAEKMDEIVLKKVETRTHGDRTKRNGEIATTMSGIPVEERPGNSLANATAEKEMLRQWLLTKFFLKRSEEKLKSVVEFGRDKRFLIFDESSGIKRRLSLSDLDRPSRSKVTAAIKDRAISDSEKVKSLKSQYKDSDLEFNARAMRQIKTILFKTAAKEETNRKRLESELKRVEPHVKAIREVCRREGRRLPVPSLSKTEIDLLQEQRLESEDIRGFGYLERIRTDRENSGEIRTRDETDLGRLSATRTLYSLRMKVLERALYESSDRCFSRIVNIDGKEWSLARLEKYAAKKAPGGSGLLHKVRNLVRGNSAGDNGHASASETMRLKNKILTKLKSDDRDTEDRQADEAKKIRVIDDILKKNNNEKPLDPGIVFTPDQLVQIESLSLRLRLPEVYEQNWKDQTSFIELAGVECRVGQKISKVAGSIDLKSFDEYKKRIIAGRSLAREVVTEIEVDKTKENLSLFRKTKRHQKFEVNNDRNGSREFVSLRDVEVSRYGSVLDRTIDYIFEDRHRRQIRSQIKELIRKKERYLKAEVKAAKAVHKIASVSAADYKTHGLFGDRPASSLAPIFTSNEMAAIELRITQSSHKSEVERLKRLVEPTGQNSPRSLALILGEFETPLGRGDRILQVKEEAQGNSPGKLETAHRNLALGEERNPSPTTTAARHDIMREYGTSEKLTTR